MRDGVLGLLDGEFVCAANGPAANQVANNSTKREVTRLLLRALKDACKDGLAESVGSPATTVNIISTAASRTGDGFRVA